MNYPDSVRFLYALGHEHKTIKFGLDRILAVLEALGNPHRRVRYVHVAGTNGKGSTCAMIEAALRASGARTGLYTSPHLVSPTERIRIGGQAIGEDQFAAAFARVHECAERLLDREQIDFHPTYFECVTAMAFLLFAEKGVEAGVLEVGLGGRLDATNVVMPALCVITPVEFDHESHLGSDLASIAAEKAGILKRGVPAVIAPQRSGAESVIAARAAQLGIEVIVPRNASGLELGARGSRFTAGTLTVECPLAGEHQVLNTLTAVAACRRLGLDGAVIAAGIRGTRWPGRLERISEEPEIVVDGAHNPSGARALASYIDRFCHTRRVTLIFGVMRDKAVEEIAGILFPRAWEVIVTAPGQPRALRPEAAAAAVEHPRLRLAANVAEALSLVRRNTPDQIAFVTGSLFLVAEAMPREV